MTNVKHLDNMLDTFAVKATHKRAVRKAQVELIVYSDEVSYFIQGNGKVIESGLGDLKYAQQRAEVRAATIRRLGKTCTVAVL